MSGILDDSGLDRKPQNERDQFDLAHEMRGEDVGRQQRFIRHSSVRDVLARKEKEKQAFSLLRYMLENDAQYRAAYERAVNSVNAISNELNYATDVVENTLENLRKHLEELKSRSATRDDGTHVYRSVKTVRSILRKGLYFLLRRLILFTLMAMSRIMKTI